MEEEKQLNEKIGELKRQIKPLQERLDEIYAQRGKSVHDRIVRARQGNGDFALNELLFAAYDRCMCGAGYAYPNGIDISTDNSWECSAILRGKAERGSSHSSPMPFAFYEVKSEKTNSANGATTRPTV